MIKTPIGERPWVGGRQRLAAQKGPSKAIQSIEDDLQPSKGRRFGTARLPGVLRQTPLRVLPQATLKLAFGQQAQRSSPREASSVSTRCVSIKRTHRRQKGLAITERSRAQTCEGSSIGIDSTRRSPSFTDANCDRVEAVTSSTTFFRLGGQATRSSTTVSPAA